MRTSHKMTLIGLLFVFSASASAEYSFNYASPGSGRMKTYSSSCDVKRPKVKPHKTPSAKVTMSGSNNRTWYKSRHRINPMEFDTRTGDDDPRRYQELQIND